MTERLNNYRIRVILIVLLLLHVVSTSIAQSSLFYDYYNSENGLSQNSVYSITQTSDGFMWFGTQDGINRFDGKYFDKVMAPYSKNDSCEMDFGEFSKSINVIYADQQNNLWVGTAKEIALYNRYTNKFIKPHCIYKNFDAGIEPNIIGIREENQCIWILTRYYGLLCYDIRHQQMKDLQWTGKKPGRITCLQKERKGTIWVCSEKEIFKQKNNVFESQSLINAAIGAAGITNMCIVNENLWFITGDKKIKFLNIEESRPGAVKQFAAEFNGKGLISDANSLHQSSADILWIGSRSDGVAKVNLQNHTFETLQDSHTKSTLNTKFVLSFFTDKQKITWVGLSGGIFKFDFKDTKIDLWRCRGTINGSQPDNHVFSIFSNNDVDFYMGTLNAGLLHLNTATASYQYYVPTHIGKLLSESKNIYEVIAGENNLLWMATTGGLYSFNTVTKQFLEYKDFNDVQTLELCSVIKLKGIPKLLLGGYNGELRLFDTENKKFEMCKDPLRFFDHTKLRVRYMREVENGNILMSTETNCLVKYNYHTGLFTLFPQFNNICGASRHFYYDTNYLWIATDEGLIQAQAQTMKVEKFWTSKQGLANDYLYAVLPDKYGRIWISSNAGLSMLDYKNALCRNFTLSDNLQDLEFNTASCYQDKEKNLWFGGINGLNKVLPTITKRNDYSPSPMITQINVMNATYSTDTATPYLKSIILPYTKNFISFQFQTPNYSQTDKIAYKYKLEGVDTGWMNPGNNTFLNYTQLSPGTYFLHLRSANSSDIWCAQDTVLKIIITPPWWQTWWFRILAVAFITGLLLYIISSRLNTIRKQESLKYKIIEIEMKSLRAQMNPHFIFNSLNSINGFIIENKTHLASDYLTKFSRLIRLILENSKNETIPLEKEIETLQLYLLMESLRFENKFEYHINIHEHVDSEDIEVPPLIIQPYVENAIWHGLLHKPTKGNLQIDIYQDDHLLTIEIIDDGIGREKAASNKKLRPDGKKSYGMEITSQRILNLNPENKITVSDITDNNNIVAGTKVTLQLKLK